MGGRVEILGAVERRRRWKPEDKVTILDEAFGTGGSVAAASERHGVSRALIYYWRRAAREGRIPGVGVTAEAQPQFVPVRIEARPSAPCPAEPKAGTGGSTRPTRSRPRGQGLIEIVLANGRTLKVDDGIEPERLARLVGVLDGGAE